MLYLRVLSFTCMLLLLLVYPSWELSILLIIVLGGLVAFLRWLFSLQQQYSRKDVIFAFLVIISGAGAALGVLAGHAYHISNQLPYVGESRIEGEQGGAVFLSGTVVDFRRNNAVVMNVGGEMYIIREVADVSLYQIGSELLVSGYESEAQNGVIDSFRTQYLGRTSRSLPSLFVDGFDYDMRRIMKGYRADVYAKGVIYIGDQDVGFLDQQKNHLRSRLQSFSQDQLINALVLGMIIGDVSWMSEDQYQIYIRSGLVHIVAVSGGNMVLLVIVLSRLFFWLPYYPRLFVVTLCMGGYALLCGLDSSVFRALIMGSLTLFTLFRGRRVSIYRSICFAWCIILVYSPFTLIYDVGFLLSFSALFAIVVFTRWFPLASSHIVVRGLYQYLGITLAANVGVFPILILFMGQMNLFGFLGNILVLPLVSLIMVGGALYSVLPMGYVTESISMIGTYVLGRVQQVAIYSADMHLTLITPTISSKLWILGVYIGVRFVLWIIYRYSIDAERAR